MKEFNGFQNENFEKGVMVEERPEHRGEERPKHMVEERPEHRAEERPKHRVEERPEHRGEERPEHGVEERPRSVEEKINFIINFSTDKSQLLELKKILVELEFYEKEERKEMLENDERKIRRR